MRSVIALLDWLLLSERGRRLRRWSFVVTVPVAAAAAAIAGLGTSAAVLGVRIALTIVVALVALRLGGERGEAVRDLLMHPRVRRFLRTELRVVSAPARVLARIWRRPAGEFSGYRGGEELAIAMALTPMVLAEAAGVHLLLPASWLWVHAAAAAAHLYALAWVFAWALGPRLRPHRLEGGDLLVHGGLLYAASVPRSAIRRVEIARRRLPEHTPFLLEGETALLPARRRVDLWLELAEPVAVSRPLGEPVAVRRLGLAADDPHALAAALAQSPLAAPPGRPAALGLAVGLGLPELVYGAR